MDNNQNKKPSDTPENIPSKQYNSDDIDSLLNIMHKNKATEANSNAAPACPSNNNHDDDNNDNDKTKINQAPVKPQPPKAEQKPVTKSSISTPSPHANTSVSLDDFGTPAPKTKKKKQKNKRPSRFLKVCAYLIIVFTASVIFSINFIKIANDVFAFVKDDTQIEITIPEGATTKDVAKILKENGVIKYPTIYKLYTEFRISRRSYLSGEYIAGTHTVNPSMNFDKILAMLSVQKSGDSVVRITIPEGYSTREILSLFEKNGLASQDEFIEALNSYEYDFRFMAGLDKDIISKHRFNTDYSYRLEGYLFPDTYDFYVDENPISVINKLLINFDRKFDESFYERCDQLGLTVDEIITLASMIEREGNNVEDYGKISSVFHNRLKNSSAYPFLDSDATIQYALGSHKNKLESEDTDIANPYNTYKNKGLPPGPISNPGYEAIFAALYPEETPYYFFLSRNDGVTVYSKTLAEHNAAIAKSNEIDKQLGLR